jgi:hypothetical protein
MIRLASPDSGRFGLCLGICRIKKMETKYKMVADRLPEVLLSLIMTHSLMTRVPLMEAMTGTEMSLPFSGLLNDGSGPYRGRDSFQGKSRVLILLDVVK